MSNFSCRFAVHHVRDKQHWLECHAKLCATSAECLAKVQQTLTPVYATPESRFDYVFNRAVVEVKNG